MTLRQRVIGALEGMLMFSGLLVVVMAVAFAIAVSQGGSMVFASTDDWKVLLFLTVSFAITGLINGWVDPP